MNTNYLMQGHICLTQLQKALYLFYILIFTFGDSCVIAPTAFWKGGSQDMYKKFSENSHLSPTPSR